MVKAGDDWDAHWEEYSSATQANPAHAFRRRLVLSRLNLPESGARVLDIGSGQGDLIQALAKACPGAELAGVELSRTGVEIAAAKVPKARFVQRDLLADPQPPEGLAGWATHAVCSEVLEHVDDPVKLLRSASSYLASGCRLIITVPGGPRSAFDRHIGHRRHYTRADLRSVIVAAGLRPNSVAATGFPFFNLYRATVIARGRRLINDIVDSGEHKPSGLARSVLRIFSLLLRANPPLGRLGWQIVAIASNETTSARKRLPLA